MSGPRVHRLFFGRLPCGGNTRYCWRFALSEGVGLGRAFGEVYL